ncbi:GNAT family N-acetyltransferase [Vibrio intestinalis]|uniref:GNAT family N-acetyltransferase n=1 Tax=Vibrio intestinalis TaxID=2933291 RepID=UPI0021A6A0E0|nr:GNAT family N-acetyltransferase [Vibrio intestinalis]
MPVPLILPAQCNDLEMLNDLMYELHHEHHLQAPDSFKTAEEIEQEKSIARYLDNPDCLVFVAKINDEIVGFITGHFCELISTVSQPVQMGSVDELYVSPSYRGKGIANALYQTLEQRFSEYGVKEVFVEVWHFNQGACEFYFDSGFSHHIHWLRKPIA